MKENPRILHNIWEEIKDITKPYIQPCTAWPCFWRCKNEKHMQFWGKKTNHDV